MGIRPISTPLEYDISYIYQKLADIALCFYLLPRGITDGSVVGFRIDRAGR